MTHIVCFHLFNDYSGSPKVLKMALKAMLEKGYEVDLVSSKGGVLDELLSYNNLHKHSYSYCFSDNPIVTILRYSFVQIYTFFVAFKWLFQKDVVFYINTLLPVGPALAGRIMRKHVVYHYHENAFVKGAFYKTLASAMQYLAHEIICVSRYQASFLKRKDKITVVPNALPKSFTEKLHPNADEAFNRQTILMLSSLKKYKGTREFINLANNLPQYKFVLVINDTQENIDNYLTQNKLHYSTNLAIHARQDDVTPFYRQASLVLNLSNKTLFVETFGLTALEAMSAGLPVIVPTVGGIAEMVEDDKNGYKIDVQDLDKIEKCLLATLSDKVTYVRLSNAAYEYSQTFNETSLTEKLLSVITKISN